VSDADGANLASVLLPEYRTVRSMRIWDRSRSWNGRVEARVADLCELWQRVGEFGARTGWRVRAERRGRVWKPDGHFPPGRSADPDDACEIGGMARRQRDPRIPGQGLLAPAHVVGHDVDGRSLDGAQSMARSTDAPLNRVRKRLFIAGKNGLIHICR
jgi:hypothetical protein